MKENSKFFPGVENARNGKQNSSEPKSAESQRMTQIRRAAESVDVEKSAEGQ